MSRSQFFDDFLRSQRKEKSLLIKIDWRPNIYDGIALKAFLDGFESGQKRAAIIRATKEQREQYKEWQNVFSSGVKWEKVEPTLL